MSACACQHLQLPYCGLCHAMTVRVAAPYKQQRRRTIRGRVGRAGPVLRADVQEGAAKKRAVKVKDLHAQPLLGQECTKILSRGALFPLH